MAEETTPPPPMKPEVVANPEFIHWNYPPYCELCSVHFAGEANSKTHFDGKSHKNALYAWKKHQEPKLESTSKEVLCDVCWKVLNTQNMLDIHCRSPAHLDKEKGRLTVQKLKEEYRQLKELHQKK